MSVRSVDDIIADVESEHKIRSTLIVAIKAFLDSPTDENRGLVSLLMNSYREVWIAGRT